MTKKNFTEDLDDLDDILDEAPKVEPKKPAEKKSVKIEDDDLDDLDPIEVEETDDSEDEPKPVAKKEEKIEFDDVEVESDDEDSNASEVKAEKCEFKIMSDDMLKFLNKIELGNFIKDGYIKVEADRLYCSFSDQNTRALYGFIGRKDGVEITKTGSFIVQDLKKFAKVIGLFNGKIIVSYDNGFIRVASANSKKTAKNISYDKGYVDSLSAVVNSEIDLEKGKIGKHNFFKGSSFSIKKEHLKELLDASEAIENADFRFNVTTETDEIVVYVSNEQDRVEVPFKVFNANITTKFNQTFSFPALKNVLKVLADDIQVFVTDAFILFKSDMDHYVYMSNATN